MNSRALLVQSKHSKFGWDISVNDDNGDDSSTSGRVMMTKIVIYDVSLLLMKENCASESFSYIVRAVEWELFQSQNFFLLVILESTEWTSDCAGSCRNSVRNANLLNLTVVLKTEVKSNNDLIPWSYTLTLIVYSQQKARL